MAVPWLPSSALLDARTAAPVVRALGDWSADWLSAGALTAPPRWEAFDADAGTMGYRLVHQGGFRLLAREDGGTDLAELLLGRSLGERGCRTHQDRVVIDHLAKVALAALAERLGDVLPRSDETPASQWFALPIAAPTGVMLLRIEAARPVLVALAAEWAGPARRNPAPAARGASFSAHRVRLSARIGTIRLALTQIEALEVGDVLTLDAPLNGPIDACIDGRRTGDAALSLVAERESLNLKIERPACQW